MVKITSEIAYKATMERIEELLPLVDDNTPLDNKNLIELDLLSNLVADYEDEHLPIANSQSYLFQRNNHWEKALLYNLKRTLL